MVERESHGVAAGDGTRLNVREAVPAGAREGVLFVHGATYGSRAGFDPPVGGGYSTWFDAVTRHGRAAFSVDVRGYGGSERPAEMAESADENGPVVRAETAVDDIRDALAFVEGRVGRVHLVGWSWGTMTTGRFVARESPDVASLTLFAPVYRAPEFDAHGRDVSGAYRTVTRADARERWDGQVPGDVAPSRWRGGNDHTDPVFEAFWGEVRRTQGVGDGAIAAPMGAIADVRDAAAGDAPYDPGEIAVPTLVVRGSRDTESTRGDALDLYDDIGAPNRRKEYVEIAAGTHMLALEAGREALFDAVGGFQRRHA